MIKKIFLTVFLCTVCMFTMAQSQTITHVVQRGETIESIAEFYKVSVEDINKTNPNADGIVYVGMKLVIPTSSAQPKTSSRDVSIETSQTKELTPESIPKRNVSKEDKEYGKFNFAGELGFGFIKGKEIICMKPPLEPTIPFLIIYM